MRQRQPHTPRLSRQGFVPAGNSKAPTPRHMAIPKGCWSGGPSPWALSHGPDPVMERERWRPTGPERIALQEICELGSIEQVNGKTYLVAPVSSYTVEILAAFEADREDLEDDNVDLEHDGREPQHDREASNAEDGFCAQLSAWASR